MHLYGDLHFIWGKMPPKKEACPTCLCEQQKDILSVIFTLFPLTLAEPAASWLPRKQRAF